MDDKKYKPLDSINNPGAYPENYLDQISSGVNQKKPLFSSKMAIVVGGLVVLLIIFGALALFATPKSNKVGELESLSTRLIALQSVTEDAERELKSSQLRSVNSNLSIYLTNTNRDIEAPLTAAGLNDTKKKSDVVDPNTEKLTATLEDARLNAIYDRTYAREINFQLATAQVELDNVYKTTTSNELKTFAKQAADNLTPIKEQFNDYLATDG